MTNILNLPRYNILSSRLDDHDYHIEVETAIPSENRQEAPQ